MDVVEIDFPKLVGNLALVKWFNGVHFWQQQQTLPIRGKSSANAEDWWQRCALRQLPSSTYNLTS